MHEIKIDVGAAQAPAPCSCTLAEARNLGLEVLGDMEAEGKAVDSQRLSASQLSENRISGASSSRRSSSRDANRRASSNVRRFGSMMRNPVKQIKASTKNLLVFILILIFIQGCLQTSYHWLNAHLWSQLTSLTRAYMLIVPQMIWYTILLVGCFYGLVYVKSMEDDTLLKMVRQALGLEFEDGEDILSSFRQIATNLQEAIDGYERMRGQVEHMVSNLGKMARVGRTLAENVQANKEEAFESPEERATMLADLSEIMYEFMAQMRGGRPTPTSPRADKETLVKEVSLLLRELKHWSEEEYNPWASSDEEGAPTAANARFGLQQMRQLTSHRGSEGAADGGGGVGRSAGGVPVLLLPAEWRQAVDSKGQTYYYHRTRREPQWHVPTTEDEGEPPPPPPLTPPPPVEPPSPVVTPAAAPAPSGALAPPPSALRSATGSRGTRTTLRATFADATDDESVVVPPRSISAFSPAAASARAPKRLE